MRKRTIVLASSTLIASVLLVGCTTTTEPATTAPVTFDHIHALASTEGGALLVSSHAGVYRLDIGADGTTTAEGPIGDLDFDLMGYAVSGGTAYASGHPGPTTPAEFAGPNLGLIRSDDGGLSWSTLSLGGETDFHGVTVGPALERTDPEVVYGLDSSNGVIRRSVDGGLTWADGAALAARTIFADPTAAGTLYATTADGLAVSLDSGATFAVDPAAPALYLVAGASSGGLVGVDTTGTLWVSDDAGAWKSGGSVTSAPQAIYESGGRLYVADDRGIAFTEDLGASWVVTVITG